MLIVVTSYGTEMSVTEVSLKSVFNAVTNNLKIVVT